MFIPTFIHVYNTNDIIGYEHNNYCTGVIFMLYCRNAKSKGLFVKLHEQKVQASDGYKVVKVNS